LVREQRLAQEREYEIYRGSIAVQSYETGAAPCPASFPDLYEIQALLPTVQEIDILTFFMTFGRILESNKVD